MRGKWGSVVGEDIGGPKSDEQTDITYRRSRPQASGLRYVADADAAVPALHLRDTRDLLVIFFGNTQHFVAGIPQPLSQRLNSSQEDEMLESD
jgi:hypothetical protein